MHNAEQVVQQVDGLNSVSTLHRWRKHAEELCRRQFEQKVVPVGNNNYTKRYQFTDNDVQKFQQIATLVIRGKPIKSAVTEVFIPKPTEKELENEKLMDKLIDVANAHNEQLQEMADQLSKLDKEIVWLKQDKYQLKTRVDALGEQKMDKPFQRKKG